MTIEEALTKVPLGHSGESRNPVLSATWTPAFAGVTDLFSESVTTTCPGSPQ